MTEIRSFDQFLLPEVKALLHDDENWAKETMLDACKICDGELPDDNHFHLYKEVGDETWCMDFHYEHAIVAEYVEAFRAESVDGWVAT